MKSDIVMSANLPTRNTGEDMYMAVDSYLTSYIQNRDLSDTLATVVKVVKFIKSRPQNQRLFAQLCEDEAHQTLLLHTEVHWLSWGK